MTQQTKMQALDYLLFGDVESNTRDIDAPALSFRKVFIDISKLLVERWLGTEKGIKFDNDVNDLSISDPRERMRKALENQNIPLASWVTPEADPDTYKGSIECDESKAGLAFIWKIPFAPRPGAEKDPVLEGWIKTCDEWIAKLKDNPNEEFPAAPDNYIPLATS